MRFSRTLLFTMTLGACAGTETASSPTGGTEAASGGECAARSAPDARSFAEGQKQIVMRAGELRYVECPPSVPFACEMAILEGSPASAGLFTLRLRTSAPWVMPPHSHPRAERVSVMSGSIGVGFGTRVDESRGRIFGPGDYYVNAPGAVHYVWADGPVEIQITGMGPWEVHPHE